ncbi:acyl-CoA carboxylase epsilon subunit [Streptomyces sviceus]|uniref:acyl-CoA carboxylase epsilon subunit n=1 Tax=Streptomyces sviceus TaxID=285530 RepID=UPI00367B8F62
MRPGRGRGRPGPVPRGGIAGSAPPGFGRGTVGVWPGDRARRRGAARRRGRPVVRIVCGWATSEETAVLSAVVAARAVEGPPSPSGLGPARWYRGKRTAALRPGHSRRLTR